MSTSSEVYLPSTTLDLGVIRACVSILCRSASHIYIPSRLTRMSTSVVPGAVKGLPRLVENSLAFAFRTQPKNAPDEQKKQLPHVFETWTLG